MENIKKYLPTILTIVLFIASLISFIYCLVYISHTELTSRENLLVSILLTISSSIVSWIITHAYASNEHEKRISEIKNDYAKNLELYAHKAAEKVDNLSNEISKLSLYLKEELDSEDETADSGLYSKRERMQSAIHILGTLKSINDRSLSDWQGVIPEELEKERENQQETTEELLGAIAQFKDIRSKTSNDESISRDISDLKRRLDYLIFSKTGTMSLHRKPRVLKTKVASICPKCGVKVVYKQRALPNSVKSFKCQSCESELISRWTDGKKEFFLQVENKKDDVDQANSRVKIDEGLIQDVYKLLPKQPWPKGTHKIIKEKLGISGYKFKKIVRVLIERKLVSEQKNGILLESEKSE